jgi:hypothetical protein
MKTTMPGKVLAAKTCPQSRLIFSFRPLGGRKKTQISVTSAGSSEAGERALNTLRYPRRTPLIGKIAIYGRKLAYTLSFQNIIVG